MVNVDQTLIQNLSLDNNSQKLIVIRTKRMFKIGRVCLPVSESLNWMETAFPKTWKLNGKVEHFDWD